MQTEEGRQRKLLQARSGSCATKDTEALDAEGTNYLRLQAIDKRRARGRGRPGENVEIREVLSKRESLNGRRVAFSNQIGTDTSDLSQARKPLEKRSRARVCKRRKMKKVPQIRGTHSNKSRLKLAKGKKGGKGNRGPC